MCLNGSTENISGFQKSHARCCIINKQALQTSTLKMTPGRTGGTGTDGERPLEHSVMKRSTENSLIQRAFQMNPVRVLCLIYFGNSHLMDFFFFFLNI